jgi:hypothetical protein
VAIGTIALAAAAFLQIVMGSVSRPDFTLEVEEERVHTRLEGSPPRMPWIRLVVRNGRRRRAAHGARVLVQWYRAALYDTKVVSLAGPELGWPSTSVREGDGAVIFGGTSRPVDFGALGAGPAGQEPGGPNEMMYAPEALADGRQWWFRFTLAMHAGGIFIGREFLPPIQGGYVARVTVGADEAAPRSSTSSSAGSTTRRRRSPPSTASSSASSPRAAALGRSPLARGRPGDGSPAGSESGAPLFARLGSPALDRYAVRASGWPRVVELVDIDERPGAEIV